MPIYEYRCPSCGIYYELITNCAPSTAQYEPPLCHRCDILMERVPSAPAIKFKGKGWTPRGDLGEE